MVTFKSIEPEYIRSMYTGTPVALRCKHKVVHISICIISLKLPTHEQTFTTQVKTKKYHTREMRAKKTNVILVIQVDFSNPLVFDIRYEQLVKSWLESLGFYFLIFAWAVGKQ